MSLSKKLPVGTPIWAKHGDKEEIDGVVEEVLDANHRTGDIIFYTHRRRRNVLRVGAGGSYRLRELPQPPAPSVSTIDRIDGIVREQPTRYHCLDCNRIMPTHGDEKFQKSYRCEFYNPNTDEYEGCKTTNAAAHTCTWCAAGVCSDCISDDDADDPKFKVANNEDFKE